MADGSKTSHSTTPHGIGPVTRKWLAGAWLYQHLIKQLDDDVALREAAVIEREYRHGRYRNPVLPVLMGLQNCDTEVLAGFADMLCDLLAVQLDGNSHDAKHVRELLKTAVIS